MRRIGGLLCATSFVLQVLLNLNEIIKVNSLAPADRGMQGRSYLFRAGGHSVTLDGSLFGGAREIYGRRVYFRMAGFSIGPTDVVMDLGANAGVFTTLAALMGRKVVAVEAQQGFISRIQANLQLNACSEKALIEFGLLGPVRGLLGDLSTFRSPEFTEMPPVLSMSEILARHNLDRVDFMKIDIEGSEFDLLTRDNRWLSQIDKIAMEVHGEFGDAGELVETLKRKDFEVWLMDNDGAVKSTLPGDGYIFAKRNR